METKEDENFDTECAHCFAGCYEDDLYELPDGSLVCEGCWEDTDPNFYDDYEREDLIDGVGFANPGSALRAATADNPRSLPCPTCGQPNRLTPIDQQRGYCCDDCANRAEGIYY